MHINSKFGARVVFCISRPLAPPACVERGKQKLPGGGFVLVEVGRGRGRTSKMLEWMKECFFLTFVIIFPDFSEKDSWLLMKTTSMFRGMMFILVQIQI